MQINEFMSTDLATCTPDTPLNECAQKMKEYDCGMIPVLSTDGSRKPIGVLTDRDITIRTLAEGINPMDCTVGDVMSSDPLCISANAGHQEAEKMMEENQVRRLLVVDDNGDCAGLISQADLARNIPLEEIGEVVQHISEPSQGAGFQA